MKLSLSLVFLLGMMSLVAGDLYMHNPRGSNNRLNEASTNRANANRLFDSQNNGKGGYGYGPYMHYYVNSMLEIEYTSQHGAGGNTNTNCQVVIQYMCGDEVRDGITTNTIPEDADAQNMTVENPDDKLFRSIEDTDEVYVYGMHESYEYYQDCRARGRNGGLFIADRNVGSSARSTRQNNGGTRRGFECPEERDYYPYWHPSPWVDVAVLDDSRDRCEYYKSNSENQYGRHYCSDPVANDFFQCRELGAEWLRASEHGGREVDCSLAGHSRDNHLGNGPDGRNNRYMWRIPDDPHEHCVLRVRYNVSTADYNGWGTHAESNGANSPVKQDPYVPYGSNEQGETNFTLAIDTSQFGRTFQDRSHTFAIRSRSGNTDFDRIYNINVRGKRGNIVQTYPATEYDFVPQHLTVFENSYVHFQWTGSDTNPAGNDGEGRTGTDRSNIIELYSLNHNRPIEFGDSDLFDDGDALYHAMINQTDCLTLEELQIKHNNNAGNMAQDEQNCMILNAASQYFNSGTRKVTAGTYRYMSSRNNNYTNRSQKASLTVDTFLPVWATVLVVLSAVVCLSAIGLSIFGFVARLLPKDTAVARGWRKVNFMKDATEDDMDMDVGGDADADVGADD